MMVPRAFLHTSVPPGRLRYLDEKKPGSPRPKEHVSLHYMPPRSTPEPVQKSQAVPVKIPERKKVQTVLRPNRAQQDVRSVPIISLPAEEPMQILRAGSGAQRIDSLLAATTIPPRKKPRPRPSQRLPHCNHVADFSKLLLEDVMSTDDGSLTGSLSNPQFDGLFGEFHELNVQSRGGIEGVPGSLISLRSLSSESIPSLDNDSIEASFNDITSPLNPSSRSTSERRLRQLSSSEDCAGDHPLLHLNHLD